MNIRRMTLATLAAAALTAAGTQAASAATHGPSGYAQQASRAGLSQSQAAYLQHKIDGLITSNPTARQVSANTVEIGGKLLAIGAPGQKTVQAIGISNAAAAAACPSGYLCTYHNGQAINYYYCTTHYLSGWTGLGYIFNNQTTGTKSILYKLNGDRYMTDIAKDQVTREVNWDPVWSIHVC
jgi:hypothetical protein